MAKPLLNVRLTAEDERNAKLLRERGVSMSELVRQALRDAVARVESAPLDPNELEAEMLRLYPTPPDSPASRPDGRDRRAIQAYIREKLRSSR